MTRPFRSVAAAVLALAVSACGGSGAGSSGADGSLPNARVAASDSMPLTKHKLKAKIRIVIPRRRHHRRMLVHGHFISPATQSIAIAVTPSAGGTTQNFNADLTTASNPDCTVSLVSPLICTITISLAPGSYTGTFATYDGLLNGTAILPATNSPPIKACRSRSSPVRTTSSMLRSTAFLRRWRSCRWRAL